MTEELIDEGINNYRASDRFTQAEKAALEYSELTQFNPDRIDDRFYSRLRRHYTEPEIVELGVFIGFNVGYHTFFRTLDFYPMFSPDGRLVGQEESRRIYGELPVSQPPGPPTLASSQPLKPSREGRGRMVIEPISRKLAEQKGLGDIMASCDDVGVGDDKFLRILGHVPGYADAMYDAMYQSHALGNLDHSLKEIIRIQLARTAEDPYFSNLRSKQAIAGGLSEERIDAGSGDFENDPQFTEAEKWALRYAYLMYRKPETIDHDFYRKGKNHFTEAEIMELGGMIAVHYGMQVFMRTLQPRSGLDEAS